MSFKKVIYENYFFTKKCYYLLHLYYKLLYYHRSTLGQFSSARVTNFQKLFFFRWKMLILTELQDVRKLTRLTFVRTWQKKIHFPFSCMEKFASSLFLKKKYCWKVFGTKKFVAQPMVFMHCLFVIEKCVEVENFQNIN